MTGRLLATISIVLFVAGIVTLNLNSAVWAKSESTSDSKSNFRYSEMINGKDNTKTNDNGNTQSNDNGNTQSNDNGNTQSNDNGNMQTSNNCDSKIECQKILDNAMGMLQSFTESTFP
mgnify:CR=1 FL=1